MAPLSQFSECRRYWSLAIAASGVSVITTAKPKSLQNLRTLTCCESICRLEQLERKNEAEILIHREDA